MLREGSSIGKVRRFTGCIAFRRRWRMMGCMISITRQGIRDKG